MTTFCTLGIANDSRGGDSCGYFIDGHYEYGYKDSDKLFRNFFQGNKFLHNLKTCTIAFGHCRKASVGAINESTAQPVVLTNEEGKVEYVLMHNGTIHNYKELAKKYIPKVDITGMTDSQVMARIFYYTGYESLSEYNGGAVFAIVDYRQENPKIILFKGASKETKWSKSETEERPLYYCIDPVKGELVFSSIAAYLFSLRYKLVTWILTPNIIHEFDGKDLVEVKEVPRVNVYQKKEVIYNQPFNYDNFYVNDFGLSETNGFIYDKFITLNETDNTYYGKGVKLNGRVIIDHFGKLFNEIPKKNTSYKEIFFWDGVALKNIACYRFLLILKKKSFLEDKVFNKTFENLIRYLSIDGIYCDNNIWYQATSATKRVPFTGILKMLTSTSSVEFIAGCKRYTRYNRSSKDAFYSLEENKISINFKTIEEECKFLMK